MGGSPSKEVVYVESDESKQAKVLSKLENQLEDLRKEVVSVRPCITEGVRETISSEQDALLMRYSQLTDVTVIEENIREVFGNFPVLEFIVDTATRMVSAMNSTEEMTEILRWQERKLVKRVGSRVYGIEAHFKVKILEKEKGTFRTSKDTVVLIAYKCLAHVMDRPADDYPDDNELKRLTF